MIRVCGPSRLHFGLLNAFSAETWPNLLGEHTVAARRFGGAGLMIAEPGIELSAEPAAEWSAQGPLADRALEYARRIVDSVPAAAVRPQRLVIADGPPEHCGMGTGTQLGLAVARALMAAFSLPDPGVLDLARRAGRGQRSGIGVHGFAQGGFLIEAGQRAGGSISPLVARVDFPEPWRLVVVLPAAEPGMHGGREEEVFARLKGEATALETTDRLCRLILLGMLPALQERDLNAFGEALYDFNLGAGQAFTAAQGGSYAGGLVADLIAFVRRQGLRGVGQSSWGPAVYAVVEDDDRGADLVRRIRTHFQSTAGEVWVTRARNRGATLECV